MTVQVIDLFIFWERHLEGRSASDDRVDGQLALMAGQDMFGDGEAQTGAADPAAMLGADAVKAFRQAREMLGRDARAVVGDSNGHTFFARIAFAFPEMDFHRAADAAVFDGVFDQIVKDLDRKSVV